MNKMAASLTDLDIDQQLDIGLTRYRALLARELKAPHFSDVTTDIVEFNDLSAFAGEAVTVYVLSYEKNKRRLERVITQFLNYGYAGNEDDMVRISPLTAKNARAFFRLLSRPYCLPRVAPDGEGGLAMIWEDQNIFVLDIDGDNFSYSYNPGRVDGSNDDGIEFYGDAIPDEILNFIPKTA